MKRVYLSLALLVAVLLTGSISYGQYITTFAGIGFTTGYSGDGGQATDAVMFSPSDIAFDASGNLFIADFINNVIRKVDTFGIITTVAGNGYGHGTAAAGGFTGDGGPATNAELNGPFAIAIDHAGNIIFADGYNHVVRKVDATGTITTIAGTYLSAGFSGDGGPAVTARLNNPVGVAIDRAGNIYVADDHNNAVRKINTDGIISTVAGNSTVAGRSGDGGPATAAKLNQPIGIALDTAGNLYIADSRNNVIRKVNAAGTISTVAGIDTAGYAGDGGLAVNAKLDSPQRIAFDDSDNLYICDYLNNVVREVKHTTGVITTIAGNGYGAGSNGTMGGYGGDDSLAINAELFIPHGMAFNKAHELFICDRGNDVVRKVGPPPPVDHTLVQGITGASSTLLVYPNPSTQGMFTILLSASMKETAGIVVTDMLGVTVQKISATTNVPVNLKLEVPTGIYLITATTATGRVVKQVAIQ